MIEVIGGSVAGRKLRDRFQAFSQFLGITEVDKPLNAGVPSILLTPYQLIDRYSSSDKSTGIIQMW